MYQNIRIVVTAKPGSAANDIAIDIDMLAEQLGVGIECKVAGHLMFADPGELASRVLRRWEEGRNL